MSLPVPPNVRVAIYRAAAPPPADAVADNVPGYLESAYDEGLEATESSPQFRYTHRLLLDGSVDIRDDFQEFDRHGPRDLVYLPDAAGTAFEVVYVERPFRGHVHDVKRVYLNRRQPSWPTPEL